LWPPVLSTIKLTVIAMLTLALPITVSGNGRSRQRALGTEQFRILYAPADEDQAIIAQQAASTALRRLQQALDIKLQRRIQIHICHTQQEFNHYIGETGPPWLMGQAFPNQSRVVVKAIGPQRIGRLVAHELTHVVLQHKLDQTGAPAPRWLHEGLAQYATGDLPSGRRQVLSQAAAADKLLTLEEVEKAFGGPVAKVNLAYAQSYTLVGYLAQLNPGEGLGRFLDELGEVSDVDRALVRAYHKPAGQLEEEWLGHVRRAYLGRGIMNQYGTIIWVAMAALFAVVVAVKLWRARRIRQRMQQEERLRQLLEGGASDSFTDR